MEKDAYQLRKLPHVSCLQKCQSMTFYFLYTENMQGLGYLMHCSPCHEKSYNSHKMYSLNCTYEVVEVVVEVMVHKYYL